jgi:tellurite methyltransferase
MKMTGGYDEGYTHCPCFWGKNPSSLVKKILHERDVRGAQVLDLGCGEGKNAAAFAQQGATVLALDCSETAIGNGKRTFKHPSINWQVGDVLNTEIPNLEYDYVVIYGLLHCLSDSGTVEKVVNKALAVSKRGCLHILATFNDGGHQNMEVAHPGFRPLLLSHSFFLSLYEQHCILYSSNEVLHEHHPNNNVLHSHTLTRLIVEIA